MTLLFYPRQKAHPPQHLCRGPLATPISPRIEGLRHESNKTDLQLGRWPRWMSFGTRCDRQTGRNDCMEYEMIIRKGMQSGIVSKYRHCIKSSYPLPSTFTSAVCDRFKHPSRLSAILRYDFSSSHTVKDTSPGLYGRPFFLESGRVVHPRHVILAIKVELCQ